MRKAALGAVVFVAAASWSMLGQKAHAHSTQKLVTKPKIVVVREGDSLSKIAQRQHTTYRRIYYANSKIKHPDLIYPNDKLRIPRKSEKLKKRQFPQDVNVPAEPTVTTRAHAPASQPKTTWQQPAVKTASVASGSVWDRLAQCESGGNWQINTGNGYYGGLQFTLATWRAVGGSGYPHQASRSEQIHRGQILQARSGWGQWPACTARLGLH